MYDCREVGIGGCCSIGIGSSGKEGSVGKIDVIPEDAELKCGTGW